MVAIIEKLHEDHRNISKLLSILQEQNEKLAAGEYTDFQLMSDIMRYFVNYPDVHHHPYEDFIFSELKKKDITLADEIDKISSEHQSMAAASSEVMDEITQIQGNVIFSRDKIVQKIKKYIINYYAHMDKEETSLLKLADAKLDADDWQVIDDEINVEDDPLFGKLLDDEYENLLNVILAKTE